MQIDSAYTTIESRGDLILSVGDDSITLKDVLAENSYTKIKIQNTSTGEEIIINNWNVMNGTPDNDLLINASDEVTINGLEGDDTIESYGHDDIAIFGGDGDDSIYSCLRRQAARTSLLEIINTVDGGIGNDT